MRVEASRPSDQLGVCGDPQLVSRARGMRIRYSPGMPDEVRIAVAPHVERWAFLAPAWCRYINVVWGDEETSNALSVTAHYEYRRATLYIHPNFLTCPDRREENIVHELSHLLTEPMYNTMRDLKAALVDKVPELQAWATEAIRYAVESTTCDLTDTLMRAASAPTALDSEG
jgi:hypothetical protein